eukprot:6002109-Karenia_brevis.AAC.1
MRLEIKQAVGMGLIPPLTDQVRFQTLQPKAEDFQKVKSESRKKNSQARLHRLKTRARLVAWLDSYIV